MDRWSIDHLLIGERMLSDHLVSDDSVLSVEEALPAKIAVAEQIAEKVEALTSSNVRRNYIAHRSHELYTFLHVRWHHKHVFFVEMTFVSQKIMIVSFKRALVKCFGFSVCEVSVKRFDVTMVPREQQKSKSLRYGRLRQFAQQTEKRYTFWSVQNFGILLIVSEIGQSLKPSLCSHTKRES